MEIDVGGPELLAYRVHSSRGPEWGTPEWADAQIDIAEKRIAYHRTESDRHLKEVARLENASLALRQLTQTAPSDQPAS